MHDPPGVVVVLVGGEVEVGLTETVPVTALVEVGVTPPAGGMTQVQGAAHKYRR